MRGVAIFSQCPYFCRPRQNVSTQEDEKRFGSVACSRVIVEYKLLYANILRRCCEDKVAVVGRNLVVLASDTPAEVRVSYYETSDGTSNKLVKKTIQTPYVLDMGKVVVKYDSVDYKWRGGYCGKKHLIDGHKVLNVGIILGEGGAEYLKLENRSEQVVKFAVVGVQKLVTKRDDERNVIESQPSPVLAHQCNTSIKKLAQDSISS